MVFSTNDISINTVIGPESSISGNLNLVGFIRIDGNIEGNIETTGNIIIGENARVKGDITAKSAIIGGIVLGSVLAVDGVQLLSTSVVIGDIITTKLRAEEKTVIQGHCYSICNKDAFEKYSHAYLEEKEIKNKVFLK